MDIKTINNLKLTITNLNNKIENYKEQLYSLRYDEEYPDEELISSIEDNIVNLEKELKFSFLEYKYLSDKNIIHDIDDIRKLFFGYFIKIYRDNAKVSTMWVNLYNMYRNDKQMLDDLTYHFQYTEKDKVLQQIKNKLGE